MAEEQILDEELQRRIKIVSLFQHGGYKLWKEKFDELQTCFSSEKDKVLSKEVNPENLALLNYRLGRLAGLSAVQAILDELYEEISPSDGVNSEEVQE